MPQPLVFISYSHRDGVWKDRLLSHLRPLEKSGVLGVWHDGMLTAGSDWLAEIRGALSTARVAILLITADFLGSDFIQRAEVAEILERRQREGLHVIPVIVKSCLWQNIEWLSAIQVRPPQGKPLAEHRGNQRDTQLTAIAAEVNRCIINDSGVVRSTAPPPSGTQTIDSVDEPRTMPGPVSSPPPAEKSQSEPPTVHGGHPGLEQQPGRIRRELVWVGALLITMLALIVYQVLKSRTQEVVTSTTTETGQKKETQTNTIATATTGSTVTGTIGEGSPGTDSKPVAEEVHLWTDSTIPFVIAADLPNQTRVTDAISYYEEHTNLRFVPRTNERNYVQFRVGTGCSASLGMIGGEQYVNMGSGCPTGSVLHLLGHTIGLQHESSRPDRDQFVTIDWTKVQPGSEHHFKINRVSLNMRRPYDYASIMHLPARAYSVDGSPTITPIGPDALIGQRHALSKSDIALINGLYLTAGRSQ